MLSLGQSLPVCDAMSALNYLSTLGWDACWTIFPLSSNLPIHTFVLTDPGSVRFFFLLASLFDQVESILCIVKLWIMQEMPNDCRDAQIQLSCVECKYQYFFNRYSPLLENFHLTCSCVSEGLTGFMTNQETEWQIMTHLIFLTGREDSFKLPPDRVFCCPSPNLPNGSEKSFSDQHFWYYKYLNMCVITRSWY